MSIIACHCARLANGTSTQSRFACRACAAGYTLSELKAAGYDATELKVSGYTAAELTVGAAAVALPGASAGPGNITVPPEPQQS